MRTIILIGAGEFTSVQDGASRIFMRFTSVDQETEEATEFDLPVSEEQLAHVMSFLAPAVEEEKEVYSTKPSTPSSAEEIGPVSKKAPYKPPVDEEEDEDAAIIQLRGPRMFAYGDEL